MTPTFERVLVYTFIPVVGIHDSHVIMLEVGREGFIPIQGFGPSIIHDQRGGPFRGGITTGGRGRDKGVGGGRGRHDKLKEQDEGRDEGELPLKYPAMPLFPGNHHQNTPLLITAPRIMFQPPSEQPLLFTAPHITFQTITLKVPMPTRRF